MEGVSLAGLEKAVSAIEANGGKGTKGDKFSQPFSHRNIPVSTFSEFFQWKMDQIAARRGDSSD